MLVSHNIRIDITIHRAHYWFLRTFLGIYFDLCMQFKKIQKFNILEMRPIRRVHGEEILDS